MKLSSLAELVFGSEMFSIFENEHLVDLMTLLVFQLFGFLPWPLSRIFSSMKGSLKMPVNTS